VKKTFPSEQFEAECLVRYMDSKNLLFSHINNEQFTRSWAIKAKNKRSGVRKGIPDYLVIVNNHLIFIELKKQKGGRVSPEQKMWIEALTACGVDARVCEGFEKARAFIEEKT